MRYKACKFASAISRINTQKERGKSIEKNIIITGFCGSSGVVAYDVRHCHWCRGN